MIVIGRSKLSSKSSLRNGRQTDRPYGLQYPMVQARSVADTRRETDGSLASHHLPSELIDVPATRRPFVDHGFDKSLWIVAELAGYPEVVGLFDRHGLQ